MATTALPDFARTDWNGTVSLIAGLWPGWQPTEDQMDLWRSECARLNQIMLREAVRRHRVDVRWKEPDLGGVLKQFHGAREQRGESGAPGSQRWDISAEEEEAYNRVERDILRELWATPHDQLMAARDAVLRIKTFIAAPYELNRVDDVERWTPHFRGLVWAYLHPSEHVIATLRSRLGINRKREVAFREHLAARVVASIAPAGAAQPAGVAGECVPR